MTDTNDLFTEESDNNNIDLTEVAAFLSDVVDEQEVQPTSMAGEVPDDIKEMLQDDHETEEQRVNISPDTTFEDDKRKAFEDMFVSVRDIDIPITEEDKLVYMKGLLFSRPIELEIKAPNGISGKCRALSVYEGDIVTAALGKYLEKYPSMSAGFNESIIQQYRAAMQLKEFCGKPLSYLEYERGNGTFEEHVNDLFETSQHILDVPGPVYGIYIRILNIFQYKLGRLHDAAFNSDFWSPVDTD